MDVRIKRRRVVENNGRRTRGVYRWSLFDRAGRGLTSSGQPAASEPWIVRWLSKVQAMAAAMMHGFTVLPPRKRRMSRSAKKKSSVRKLAA
jgi:hypothetical protein